MENKKVCPFCNLASEKLILDESDLAMVIYSNPRLTKCHLLVVPKRHVEEPWELTADERNEIFFFINKYQKLISEKLATGCDVRQNYRPFIAQGRLKVDHVHHHLIPRTLNDELYERSMIFESEIFADLQDNEILEVKDMLEK